MMSGLTKSLSKVFKGVVEAHRRPPPPPPYDWEPERTVKFLSLGDVAPNSEAAQAMAAGMVEMQTCKEIFDHFASELDRYVLRLNTKDNFTCPCNLEHRRSA